MSLVILIASPHPLTRTRSHPDALWLIWALTLSSAPLQGKLYTLAKLRTHIATRSRKWLPMTRHQSLRSPCMGMRRNLQWTSISSSSNTYLHLFSCRSRSPRRHRNHSNFPKPRGFIDNPVDITWLILVLSALQIRKFDEWPTGRARDRVVVTPQQDTTRETRAIYLVALVLLRPLRMTSMRLHPLLRSTSCPLELLHLAATTDRNDRNARYHVDPRTRFAPPSLLPLSPPFASLCLHLHLQQKHWTFPPRFYATFNIDTMAFEPWPLAFYLPSFSHPSSRPVVLSHENPVPTLLHPRSSYWTLFPLGYIFRNRHSSWRFAWRRSLCLEKCCYIQVRYWIMMS